MSDYKVRGVKFADYLARLFDGCVTLEDYKEKVETYNATHSRKLVYDYGATRFTIIRHDYVVKFEYCDLDWDYSYAGNNATENAMYLFAVEHGYERFFCPCVLTCYKGRYIEVMPRIRHIEDESRIFWDYLTEEESDWISYYVCDLHRGNVGYYRGRPVIIDYAFNHLPV